MDRGTPAKPRGRQSSRLNANTEVATILALKGVPAPCAAAQLPASAPAGNLEAVNAALAKMKSEGILQVDGAIPRPPMVLIRRSTGAWRLNKRIATSLLAVAAECSLRENGAIDRKADRTIRGLD
jgi:hypothetical protein